METASATLVILAHVAGLLAALHALSRPHSPQGTLAWILALLLLPIPALLFYLILGEGKLRRRRGSTRHPFTSPPNITAASPPNRPGTPNTTDHPGQPNHPEKSPKATLPGLGRALENLTGLPPCTGNCIQLLQNGEATYTDLARAIIQANESILIEFYIIRNDRVGGFLHDLLCWQAGRGLTICVLYDELGCHKLPGGYLNSLRRAGVRVTSFNGKRYWWSSILRLNHRNHRKLVIIDSERAYLGSLNIGLEYLRPHPLWRDTFIRMQGPIVQHALLCFRDDWHHATGEELRHLLRPAEIKGNQHCQIIPSGPDDGSTNAWQYTLLELAARARKRLWLATPYFVPTPAVLAALQSCGLRGVDVRILVPSRSDSRLATLAMLTSLPSLSACGVRLFAYDDGFLHQKISLIDTHCCTVGTANLDERSLHLNFELTLLLQGRRITRRMAAMLHRDMQHARPLTEKDWHNLPIPRQLLAHIARLLSPIL